MSETIVFASNYPALYLRSLEEWVKEMTEDGITVNTLTCRSDIFVESAPWSWETTCMGSSSDLFNPEAVVVITHLELLDAKEVEVLVNRIKDMDSDYSYALVIDSVKIPKSVHDLADEIVVCDHLEQAGGWGKKGSDRAGRVREWFRDYDIDLSKSDCASLVDYCGEDNASLSSAMYAAVSLAADEEVTLAKVLAFVPGAGAAIYWELNQAIFDGDRTKVAELLHREIPRISTIGSAIGLIKMAKTKLHNYGVALGKNPSSNKDVEWVNAQIGNKGGRYAINEANMLGTDRLASCFEIVRAADKSVRERFNDPETAMVMMATRLSQQVHLARQSKSGSRR